ncbi:MAG TPA: DUF4120 family protein [Tenuifilaceae bacterium]|nr:DUF4120 family protein [Tenuifilaceae bacterium]
MIDKTDGKLSEIMKYASANGLEENLNSKLEALKGKEKDGCVVILHQDFAPLSLYFEVKQDDKLISNGGLIFHGIHDAGGNGFSPSFSVNLTPVKGWAIHT